MTSTRLPETGYIIGSDEVGTGSWAGPLVVCAAAERPTWKGPRGLTDSKKLSPDQRNKIYEGLRASGIAFSLMMVDNETIDRVGMKTALMAAHQAAIEQMLPRFPESVVIIDGVLRPEGVEARCIPKADTIFPVVSAASVIAKVNRDFVMRQYHQQYPQYGFDKNVGYGSASHQAGLEKYGVCPLHRRSYRPIKKLLETP